jgi:hypothetical protein
MTNGAIAWAADIAGNFDELAGSSGLAGDPCALRRRLVRDGHLFFRALLPAARCDPVGLGAVLGLGVQLLLTPPPVIAVGRVPQRFRKQASGTPRDQSPAVFGSASECSVEVRCSASLIDKATMVKVGLATRALPASTWKCSWKY